MPISGVGTMIVAVEVAGADGWLARCGDGPRVLRGRRGEVDDASRRLSGPADVQHGVDGLSVQQADHDQRATPRPPRPGRRRRWRRPAQRLGTAGVRFQTVVGWPAARNARASAVPMAPRPRTVTGCDESVSYLPPCAAALPTG